MFCVKSVIFSCLIMFIKWSVFRVCEVYNIHILHSLIHTPVETEWRQSDAGEETNF